MYYSNRNIPIRKLDKDKIPEKLNSSLHHLWGPLLDLFEKRYFFSFKNLFYKVKYVQNHI